MTLQNVQDLLPGEHILWQGKPDWRRWALEVLELRWIAAYFAFNLVWGAYTDRSNGLDPVQALAASVPLLLLGFGMLGVCAGLAWGCAETTSYTVTTERCLFRFGLALTATLSVPLRQIASVSVSVNADGTGNIPLILKAGRPIAFIKLWPHTKPWQFAKPQPMLRAIPDAAQVAARLSHAVAKVAPGQLSSMPQPSPVPRRRAITVQQAAD